MLIRAISNSSLSDEEKQIPPRRESHGGLVPNVSPNVNETAHMSELEKKGNLVLTEEKAFAHAHEHPEDTTPIYIVYSTDDRDNPRNWPTWRRYYIGLFASWLNVLTCWCAGSISSGSEQIQKEFGVSQDLTTLLLALYVLGFAVGPVILAPLSEYFGRRPVYVVSWFILFMFQLPIALAPNYGTLVACRFIGGWHDLGPFRTRREWDHNGVLWSQFHVRSGKCSSIQRIPSSD